MSSRVSRTFLNRFTLIQRASLRDRLFKVEATTGLGQRVITNYHHRNTILSSAILHEAEDPSEKGGRGCLAYVGPQAPCRQHFEPIEKQEHNTNAHTVEPLESVDNLLASSTTAIDNTDVVTIKTEAKTRFPSDHIPHSDSGHRPVPPLEVKCRARTRIPTPYGPAFLYLYHNSRDSKEHLAIVIDPAQLSEPSRIYSAASPIRSESLDAVWSQNETEMQRLVRGAYIGRLSSTSQNASKPTFLEDCSSHTIKGVIPPPLIRIHSECFTGETIGSMRCDCGEQLDEAIRQISLPILLPPFSSTHASPSSHPSDTTTIPGRGAIIYLRQEGRGIGLLSKIQAYNLQDMGHDTVAANLMLGHQADERNYEIAGAILRDLNLGTVHAGSDLHSTYTGSDGVRLLTNNPDKVEALQKEGIQVVERVPMIPRSWQHRRTIADESIESIAEDTDIRLNFDGSTIDKKQTPTVGSKIIVHGDDLDKYLRTKVLRMGHMLPLINTEQL